MGTWIEIFHVLTGNIIVSDVVPYVGTWIEIARTRRRRRKGPRRSLRGNVDRNSLLFWFARLALCRSLRGNVDRNTWTQTACTFWVLVVPYVGTWIEIVWIA